MTRRALVVDDSEFQRDLVTRTINDWFSVVATAENGEDAIAKFKEHEPDIVTMDIMMPKMDGLEALQEIKAISPDTIIVMVTSVTQKEKMREAARNGANGYVTKAFERNDMVTEFNDVLEVPVE